MTTKPLHPTRRTLLQAGVATAMLYGCGGGSGTPPPPAANDQAPEDAAAAPPPEPAAPAQSVAPAPPPPALAASTGAMAFNLSSASGGNALPFTLGFAFRQGDVPAGQTVHAGSLALQVSAKNRWPDGSLKFALVSGQADLQAGVARSVALQAGAPGTAAAALTTERLVASGVQAVIDAGAWGSVSWRDADWRAPAREWVAGPLMSSWIYRKPVGTDAHLVAWLEVRVYAGGAIEFVPWLENGYLRVAGASNKNATYRFLIDGQERFSAAIDLPHHTRAVLVSGAAFSHWRAQDPAVTVQHDTAYLQATRLVPAYRARLASTAQIWSRLAQTHTPLGRANFPLVMGGAGYHPSIGLLPEWDVAYLTSDGDPRAFAAVMVHAYSAGRYGIHYRDETTLRPLKFSSYPTLVLRSGQNAGIAGGASPSNTYTPTTSGTPPQVWALSHHPSIGFMAYLLSGRFYCLEQVQLTATLNFLAQGELTRLRSQGVLPGHVGATGTTRGAGWAARTLAHAACITPDDDELRQEFVASVEANAEYFHARYVAQTNHPQGFTQPYTDYTGAGDGMTVEAVWMQDFFTGAWGYALDMGLGLHSSAHDKLAQFFAWKARSIIGRFGNGDAQSYCYRDAARYTMAIAPSDTPDFATGRGPWYANWGEIYRATVGPANDCSQSTALRGSYYPGGTSYWGNLQPALAYAVEHGVPGARQAYDRMVGASNWNEIEAWWNREPVWSVKPRGV